MKSHFDCGNRGTSFVWCPRFSAFPVPDSLKAGHRTAHFIFAASLATLSICSQRGIAEDIVIDSVKPGDEQIEHSHHLAGEQTSAVQTNDQTFRIADTNGWFSWNLKVLAVTPQELRLDFGGGGRRSPTNRVEIFVDDFRVAALRLNGAPRREYYPLDAARIQGKSKITVKFQAVTNFAVSGVSAAAVEKIPSPTIASMSKASSTRTNYQFIVDVINDLREPASSRDRLKRHFDWWPAKATNQWVQYDFAKPARVSAVEVYWFDDTGIGECRMPKSWQLYYRQNGEWKPVANPSGYGREPDHYNRTTFDAIETDGLRLDAQMPDSDSVGILQWRVE